MDRKQQKLALQQQQVELLKSMGVQFNPLEQMSSLVNLINQTQAPGIQQEQFGEEMDFRTSQGDRAYGIQQDELRQRQLKEKNDQTNFGLQHGLQSKQFDETVRGNNLIAERKGEIANASQLDRKNNNEMDFLEMLFRASSNENGSGMIDPNFVKQYFDQRGMKGLINPNALQSLGTVIDRSNPDKSISDEAFDKSYKQRAGQQ